MNGIDSMKLLSDENGEWVTGSSNKDTGDITDIENIKAYAKYCNSEI